MIISFTIPGVPVAKGRPRLTTRGGFARAYTPGKTRAYEADAAVVAAGAMGPNAPAEGALALALDVRLPVPPSWPSKRRLSALEGLTRPCGRPDIDNYAKALCDALNGIVWHDDAQVVRLTAEKRYSDDPGVGVVVSFA